MSNDGEKGRFELPWPTTEDAKQICEKYELDGVIVIGLRTKEGSPDMVSGSTHGKNEEMKKGMIQAMDNIHECWKMMGK